MDGVDLGTAGASARREEERRRAKRGAADSWASGAAGEEELGAFLASRCPEVTVLHDRRLGRGRANIDHIAVCASGVVVIDAKRYRGKIEVRSPFFGQPQLRIAGRRRTKLVDGLLRQREAVRSALDPIVPEMPIDACFCFLNPPGQAGGSGLPTFRKLEVAGLPLYYPRRLAKRLNATGALSPESQTEVAALLAELLPPA